MPLSNRIVYSVIMLTALLVGIGLLRNRQSRLALPQSQRLAIGVAAFIGAMIGSKVPFVLDADWESLSSGIVWISDGKTILGGIFGGYICVELAKMLFNIRSRTGDSFAVPIAASVAIGRLGCFVAGCCYGSVTGLPWGCHFSRANDSPEVCRHPTQLYEFAFHSLALAWLILAEKRGWLTTQRLKAYLIAYLVYRFFSEWLRPGAAIAIGLTSYQIVCVILTAMLLVLWWRDNRPQVSAQQS